MKNNIAKSIIKYVIKNNRCPNSRIVAYADLNNRRFKSVLKVIYDQCGTFEVRPLNDYNDHPYMRTHKIRYDGELVVMCADTTSEFHIWLGGAI